MASKSPTDKYSSMIKFVSNNNNNVNTKTNFVQIKPKMGF
jgi:hypothetical protein